MRRMVRTAAVIALTVGLLVALLWLGDVRHGLELVRHIRAAYLAWFAMFLALYEGSRYILWLLLLGHLDERAGWRTQTFAFAIGEAVKIVPTGAYAQNAVLARMSAADLGRSSAATTLIITSEIVVAFGVVLIFGIDGWTIWSRLAVLALVGALVLLLRTGWGARRIGPSLRPRIGGRLFGAIIDHVRHLQQGTADLLHARPLTETLALTLFYEFCGGAGLYVVVRSLGIGGVSLVQAVAVNCFGLAFYVVLGSLEVAAAGAFVAMGVDRSAAVTAVLVNRSLGILGTFVLSAAMLMILSDQWPALLRRSPRNQDGAAVDGRPVNLPDRP